MIVAPDRVTISKLLGLVGSHHDGEALAAARKAHQLVTTAGMTWSEILGVADAQPELEISHVAIARDLLQRGRGIITQWERGFLIGVMGFKALKPKQIEMLDTLAAKIEAAGADL